MNEREKKELIAVCGKVGGAVIRLLDQETEVLKPGTAMTVCAAAATMAIGRMARYYDLTASKSSGEALFLAGLFCIHCTVDPNSDPQEAAKRYLEALKKAGVLTITFESEELKH